MAGARQRGRGTGPAILDAALASGRFDLGLKSLEVPWTADDAHESDRWRIAEAFRRGGSAVEILFLMLRVQESRARPAAQAAGLLFPPSSSGMTLLTDPGQDERQWLIREVAEAEMAYREGMRQEFEGLSEGVRKAFAFSGDTPFAHYLKIRPAYYNAGYADPAGTIFSRMTAAKLAGRDVVSPGVHVQLAKVLRKVDEILNLWRPGLSAEMQQLIRSVGGFVPRYIAPRQGSKSPPVLSNHALGLAIDIDPSSNPHLKDADVIKILNAVAKGSGVDFGKAIVERDPGMPDEDWAAQTHLKADMASKLIKAWLQKYLPAYDQIEGRLALEKKIATAKPAEKERLLQQLAGGPGKPGSSPAIAPDVMAEVEKIRTLRRFHPRAELEVWSKYGIQTVPMLLAVALVKAGLRWGQTYKSTKDAMHFELVGKRGGAAIPPDDSPRTLQQLFPEGTVSLTPPRIVGGGKTNGRRK